MESPSGAWEFFELPRWQMKQTTIPVVLVVSPSKRESMTTEAGESPAMVTRPFGVHALQRAIEHARDPSIGAGDEILETEGDRRICATTRCLRSPISSRFGPRRKTGGCGTNLIEPKLAP